MFLDRLMNQTNGPLLEQVLEFTAARHRLIAENMANVDTPGYLQKEWTEAGRRHFVFPPVFHNRARHAGFHLRVVSLLARRRVYGPLMANRARLDSPIRYKD